jgi:hypothetical protein
MSLDRVHGGVVAGEHVKRCKWELSLSPELKKVSALIKALIRQWAVSIVPDLSRSGEFLKAGREPDLGGRDNTYYGLPGISLRPP